MTDQLLLMKFVDGRDQAAFADLVARHGSMVLATARRLAKDDADDVSQAVFLLLSQKAPALVQHRNLSGWLYETTRYCAANARRHRQRRTARDQVAHEMAMSNANFSVADATLLEQLDEGLSHLSNTYKQVLLMRYMEELSVEETAAQLRLNAAAVMKRSTRGLSHLREFFHRRGITASVQGVAGCMVSQAMQLSADQHTRLAALGSSTAHAKALAAATRTSMTLAKAKLAGVAIILVVAASVATVETVKTIDRAGVGVPVTQPVKVVIAAMRPALLPPPAGAPRDATDQFLQALRDADVEKAARYLPPGDDAKSRALAKTYIDEFRDKIYARFPQRMMVQNSSIMIANDAAQTSLSGVFDLSSPIDADIGHLSLRVEPINGHWYVTAATYTDAEAMFVAAAKNDLTASIAAGPFDYTKAQDAFAAFVKMNDQDISSMKESDVPRLIEQLGKTRTGLQELATALKGSSLVPAKDDIQAFDEEFARGQDVLRQHGLAGIMAESDRCKKDEKLMQAGQRLMALGTALNTITDAQSEACHTGPRPVSVEPDRKLTGARDAVTIPGPLKFPEWLRSTTAYKSWQTCHDVRMFTTRDDAGNIYTVAAHGWMKDADGKTRELIPQIRMYRPDKTLAEVANWNLSGELSDWKTLDATGKHVVWQMTQREVADGHFALDRVVHFDNDGNEHTYHITPPATINAEFTANPIGDTDQPQAQPQD